MVSTAHKECIEWLALRFEITGFGPDQYGHIVVSKTDHRKLLAEYLIGLEHGGISGRTPNPSFNSIPISVAPDWTCDPLSTAQARRIATLIKATRVGRLLRWLDRKLGLR